MTPRRYRALRRLSPAIMFVAMAAFGWLMLRVAGAFEGDAGSLRFGVDIVVMVVVIAAWGAAMVVLLRPPTEVLARVHGTTSDEPLIVWALGKDKRILSLISVPFGGLIGSLVFLPAVLPSESSADDSDGSLDAVAILLIAVVLIVILAGIWSLSRGMLLGIELTGSHAIAHGFFWTRRFERGAIAHTDIVALHSLVSFLLGMLRIDIERVLRLTFHSGSRHTLWSIGGGIDEGVRVLDAWIATSSGPASPASRPD